MAVDRLVQKLKLGERRLMQDSMCKLINMISENKKTQEDIIKVLPESEIIQMMTYLEDSDPYFRKLTARFFLDLVYGNYTVQQLFCDILAIVPCDGKVCMNRIPDSFKAANKSLAECLMIMKKACVEETKDNLPYCWYFSPDTAENSENQVIFMNENEKRGLDDLSEFPDPLNAMFGFVLRLPKAKKTSERATEYVEKTISSKEYEAKRVATAANAKVLNLVNTSLDHSIHTRLLNDSKSVEREVPKNVSPARGFMAGGVVSSRISYPRNSKAKVENLASTSICNSERFGQTKFTLPSERNRGVPTKNMEREINKIFGMKRLSIESDNMKTLNSTAEIKEKKSPFNKPDVSIDNTELASKQPPSNNQSQDLEIIRLESSMCNSTLNKSSLPVRPHEKSPDISLYKVANDKKGAASKKSVDKNVKTKQSDADKRPASSYSFSAAATPKNSLLNKILKDKPAVKESFSISKYSKTKQDSSKRLNTTTGVSTSHTTKHVAQKFSIGFQPPKNLGKPDLEYNNKKYAFHSALLRSIDLHDQTSATVFIEEKEESAKENVLHDESDRRSSLKSNPKSKASHLASVLKGTAVTPRTPTDILKSTISQNSKILNSRRSYDTSSYLSSLARDKRKSEASIPLQNLKNRQSDIREGNVRNSITEFTLDFSQTTTTPKAYIK